MAEKQILSVVATTKANQALADAKTYTNEEIGKIDLSGIATNAGEIANLKNKIGTAETDIDALQAAIAENGSVTKVIADAKKAGTDAQGEVDDLGVLYLALTQELLPQRGNFLH